LLFTQEVVGSGVLKLLDASNLGGGQYFANKGALLTFSAASTESPTPEPASMLLRGTGLIAAWRSRRLRRAD
jgi:hypothetical protein